LTEGVWKKKALDVGKKKDIGIAVASNIHLQFVQPVHYVKKFSIFCEVIEICCFIFVITIFL
jgi:RNase H-fold protein (predicted Holliday junction resolvase)